MTKDDIIRMAREANCKETFGTDTFLCTVVDLERFANLVAAHKAEVALAEAYRCGYEAGAVAEREECAKLCDSHVRYPSRLHFSAAIRARKTP